MVKFGIQFGLNVARLGLSEDQILTACILADRTGYDSIWYMDHSNVPQWNHAIVNDPWVMLSAIASVTNKVELGTCVTDAVRRHPSNIALATVTLDRVSHGRGTLGIGAGEAQNIKEFKIQWDKPVGRFAEQLQVIKLLFGSSPEHRVSFKGEFYQLEEACLQAKSIRKPHTPIYMAAGAPKTLALCGKYGDGWIPIGYTPELFEVHAKAIKDSMKENGRDRKDFQYGVDIDVYFADDAEEAWVKMKNAVKVSLFKPEILKVHNIQDIQGFDFKKYFTEYSMSNQEWIVKMREAAQTIPDKVARSSIGIGTPDDIIPVFEKFMKAGVNHFIVRFWGSGYFGSLDKFASTVMPYFRELDNPRK
jgi:phthiodiolone/phenolphthiodiolone dimycocerosates ketoreductase